MTCLTGTKVVLMMTAFFGVVIAVNGVFIYEAIATFRGEDAKSAYLQGIDYNRTLDARAAQARLGWRATIGATRSRAGVVRVEVALRGVDARPVLESLRVTGSLDHPSDAERDVDLTFQSAGGGVYIGTASGVTPSSWNIVVRAKRPGGTQFEAWRQVSLP
jgi:nitrogen fixation protein FixH